jgi:hypothetical protein
MLLKFSGAEKAGVLEHSKRQYNKDALIKIHCSGCAAYENDRQVEDT